MSIERRKILESLGAQIVLTDAQKGMPGAIEQAELLAQNLENVFMPQQFATNTIRKSLRNYRSEIWNDCNGTIDIFVAAVGTGGTISVWGDTQRKNPNIRICRRTC
jgi:cysteine synthase A